MNPPHEVPDCYGEFICLDDCIVSCYYWENCMFENENPEHEGVGSVDRG